MRKDRERQKAKGGEHTSGIQHFADSGRHAGGFTGDDEFVPVGGNERDVGGGFV